MNLFILSGPVESGKTSALLAWARQRSDVRGILMPGNGADRQFLNLSTYESWPAIAAAGGAGAIEVGRYSFSPAAFARAKAVIVNGGEAAGGWLLLDEIGKLELRGEGFDTALRGLLRGSNSGSGPDALLLVVRDSLLEAVTDRYGLAAARVLRSPSELPAALPNS